MAAAFSTSFKQQAIKKAIGRGSDVTLISLANEWGINSSTLQWWMSISASYFSNNFWIPRARVDFRRNLVGSELDFANIGFTFLGRTRIDFSMSMDSINVDKKIPKAASLNTGFEKRF